MQQTYAIEANELTKRYGQFSAVNNISFAVNTGDIFAFLGPNGAGKTTTIKMLTTLLSPTTGNIQLNGINVTSDKNAARRTFGIVFQDPSLDDELTAYENMEFHSVLYHVPGTERKSKINHLLNFVELADRKDHLVKTFSGGMKRRLEIARGLLHHPKILFLDEPTLGLDPQTRNKVWEYVRNLNREEHLTVFFTTHYMEEAEKIADHIAIMDHGQIIAQGSPEDLKKKTDTTDLEGAFLALTGRAIREEDANSKEMMRLRMKMHGR